MGNAQFNPQLLTLVRECAGLSQAALGKNEVLGIKQAAISKYESGNNMPSEDTIRKLASYFGYQPSFFLQSSESFTDGLVFHRKRASLPALMRSKIEAEARLRALDAIFLCRFRNITSDLLPRNDRTPSEMAIALRNYWSVPEGPIKNVFELLEAHNIIILEFDFKTDLLDGFFLSLRENVVCLVVNANGAIPPDRRRFSILHELGHSLLARDMFPGKEAEEEANRFAAEFLAPEEDIRTELKSPITLQRLYLLKSRWGMSMAAILRRARDVGQYSDSQYRRACIFLNSKGFRKIEPPCGVLTETSKLFPNLLKTVLRGVKEPWKVLHMLRSTFDSRYGSLLGEDAM